VSDEIREIGSIQNPVFVPFQVGGIQIENSRQSLDEGKGGIQIDTGVIIEEVQKTLILPSTHMGNSGRNIGVALQDLFEMLEAEKFRFFRAGTNVEQDSFLFVHDHLIEGKEPLIVGIEPLYQELEFEPDDSGMIQDPLRQSEGVVVIGVIGRKAVKIGKLFQDTKIPFV